MNTYPDALPSFYDMDTPTALDADTVAHAIGWTPARVGGLLGPYSVATVTVWQDMDAGQDTPTWAVPDDAAVYVIGEPYLSRGGYAALGIVGDDCPDTLDAAWTDVPDRVEPVTAGRVLERYTRAHGYTARAVTLRGYSQSEWVELAVVERAGGVPVDVETLGNYMRGDVYTVYVDISHPLGGTIGEYMGGVYGDDGIRDAAASMLRELAESVSSDIRHAG